MDFKYLLRLSCLFTVLLVSLAPPVTADQYPNTEYDLDIAIVCNPLDCGNAEDLFSFFNQTNVTYMVSDAATFNPTNRVVLVLGGHRAGDGTGAFVSSILSDSEKEHLLSSDNASALFIHHDIFSVNQTVMVAAGFDAADTRRAWKDNLDQIADIVEKHRQTSQEVNDISATTSESGVTVKVNDFETRKIIIGKGNSMFVQKDQPRFGYEWLIINLTIANNANDTLTYTTRDFRVATGVQSFGRSRVKYLKWLLDGKTLAPGDSKTGRIAFEVPVRRTDFTLSYTCQPPFTCNLSVTL